VAEGARLESVFRLIPNEGSNPSLSAKYKMTRIKRVFLYLAERGLGSNPMVRQNVWNILHRLWRPQGQGQG
jgi:hypothetical protein